MINDELNRQIAKIDGIIWGSYQDLGYNGPDAAASYLWVDIKNQKGYFELPLYTERLDLIVDVIKKQPSEIHHYVNDYLQKQIWCTFLSTPKQFCEALLKAYECYNI